jgi:endonuclease I
MTADRLLAPHGGQKPLTPWRPSCGSAELRFNCEHVVPQSWYAKAEPMRGDLHHLFACEPRCNSFRSNIPYFDFADFPTRK